MTYNARDSLKYKGFMCDPQDPSVGIFGDFWWHDSCENPAEGDEISEADVCEEVVGHDGEGVNRFAEVRITVHCVDCGADGVAYYKDWDPEYEDE